MQHHASWSEGTPVKIGKYTFKKDTISSTIDRRTKKNNYLVFPTHFFDKKQMNSK